MKLLENIQEKKSYSFIKMKKIMEDLLQMQTEIELMQFQTNIQIEMKKQ